MPDAVVETPLGPPTIVRNHGKQQLQVCGAYLGPGRSFVVSSDAKTATFTKPDKTEVIRELDDNERKKLQRWVARGVLEAFGTALAMPADAKTPTPSVRASDMIWS